MVSITDLSGRLGRGHRLVGDGNPDLDAMQEELVEVPDGQGVQDRAHPDDSAHEPADQEHGELDDGTDQPDAQPVPAGDRHPQPVTRAWTEVRTHVEGPSETVAVSYT